MNGRQKMQRFKQFLTDTNGSAAVEYGLLLALLIVILAALILLIGDRIQELMTCSVVSFVPEYQIPNNINC